VKRKTVKESLQRLSKASPSRRLFVTACMVIFVCLAFVASANAQKFSRTFPAKGNVKLELKNRAGTVVVSGWAKNEIKVVATMEAPYAKCSPKMNGDDLLIDVVNENQGKGDVGNIRFDINVPFNTRVDIETKIGDIKINNVEGSLVRAHVSSEGDITLVNIRSESVMAKNISGDIFFDGELKSGGNYKFNSVQGNINIRIPQNSTFRLFAQAPASRKITLGSFAGAGLNYYDENRKVAGVVGDGKASLTVENQRGSIALIKR